MRDNTGSASTDKVIFRCAGSTNYPYNSSTWYNVTMVYDGETESAPSIDFYVNGSSINDTGTGGDDAGDDYDYSDLDFLATGCGSIGSRYSDGSYPFDGDISIVRVYNRTLTSSEISHNYNVGLTRFNAPGKGPMDVIFDSDTTNILSCESLYRDDSDALNKYIIQSSIDELEDTGIDVHMISPGVGRVPFWPSRVLPLDKHYDWFYETYSVVGDSSFTNYASMNKDLLKIMNDRCREKNIGAFVSYRVNDHHFLDAVDDNPMSPGRSQEICQFYYDHPEYRIGDDLGDTYQRVHNWIYQAPRDFIFERIEEICENYDIEGLQLDFFRWPSYFDIGATSSSQRKAIMTGFVERVRKLLNRTSKPGQHRYLGIRVPSYNDTYDNLGIDLEDMCDAGVDFINFALHYHTSQQNELTTILSSVPDRIKTFYEVTYTISWLYVSPTERHYRYLTEQMLTTTAHLAYEDGIDGISAFNFQYYRDATWDTAYEPPYSVFAKLADPTQCSADTKQHYVIADIADSPAGWTNQLPQSCAQNTSYNFTFRMAPPDSGWSGNWRLRIMSNANISGTTWQVKLNGNTLSGNGDVSEPYDADYDPEWDNSNWYKAFTAPSNYFISGNNTTTVKLTSSGPKTLYYIDLFND